ncbi:mevalonate kinase [Candidatus Gottesmanbacteria bacterium]|nr:mevalonate kinase [Candidatus Gottesmanbacteria bacterium]
MDKIVVSAPGKLLLMGEHAVIYDNPCLVGAIDKRLKVTIEKSDSDSWTDEKFVGTAVRNFRKVYAIASAVRIFVNSDFSSNYGLGSSSAITVSTTYGLYKILLNKEPDKKELFDFCYKVVLEVQGLSSGFDIAAAIYGGVLYFQTGGKTIEPLGDSNLPLLTAYSGVKADTVSMINLVKEKMTTYQKGVEEIFKNIVNLVEEAKIAVREKDWQRLGTLMNFNQNYLEDLGVSTEKLNDMIMAARKAGAYGAKLSGAGGGDCMIAIAPNEKRLNIEEAIKNVGGEIIETKLSNDGVRIEP